MGWKGTRKEAFHTAIWIIIKLLFFQETKMYISKGGGGEFPFSSSKQQHQGTLRHQVPHLSFFLVSLLLLLSLALSLFDSRELWELQETYNRLTSLTNNALKAERSTELCALSLSSLFKKSMAFPKRTKNTNTAAAAAAATQNNNISATPRHQSDTKSFTLLWKRKNTRRKKKTAGLRGKKKKTKKKRI